MPKRTDIPFFGNHNDVSCAQCVYRMMLNYFYPEKNCSMEEMDALCGAVKGKYTWPFLPMIKLSDMGLELTVYSNFDTETFLESPADYLTQKYGAEGCQDNLENSDMPSVLKQAAHFLDYIDNKKIIRHQSSHTPNVLKELIDDEHLLLMWVNCKKLNGEDGFAGHFILIHSYEGDYFIAHDPGGNDKNGNPHNQFQNRMILQKDLYDACCPKEAGETNILIAVKKKSSLIKKDYIL